MGRACVCVLALHQKQRCSWLLKILLVNGGLIWPNKRRHIFNIFLLLFVLKENLLLFGFSMDDIKIKAIHENVCIWYNIHCINWIEWKAIIFISNNTYGRLAASECLCVCADYCQMCMCFYVQWCLQTEWMTGEWSAIDREKGIQMLGVHVHVIRELASHFNGSRTATASNGFINQSNGMWLCCAWA